MTAKLGAGSSSGTEAPARPCPICGKPAASRYRPFCSKRCADIDLHRWLGGSYAVPGDVLDELADEETGPDEGR